MANLRDYQDWRPSTRQELLLKAALFNGELAFQAWRNGAVTMIRLVSTMARSGLLPLLYRNLKTLGIEDPELSQFKRAYLDTWAKTRSCSARLRGPCRLFGRQGLIPWCLKGHP